MTSRSDRPERTIRTFVKRTGRLTTSQQRALDTLWPTHGLAGTTRLDFDSVYGRRAPRVLEIGFGNGDSLVQLARERPDLDFLGIEVHEPGVGHCLLGIEEAGIDNLKLMRRDALEVLTEQIPPLSLSRVNLYFPDPWPKKRHHKRRIVQPEFLELVADRLTDDGALHIATDWKNYAQHIDDRLADSTRFRVEVRREHDGSQPLDRPPTKFETRGLKLGHRIVDWRCVKVV